MSQRVEEIAAKALRDFLLVQLPAKATAVNLLRAAVLTAPWAGPYTIPAGAILRVGTALGTYTNVTLTSGSRTAAQLAADIEAVPALAGLAAADTASRLALTSLVAPTATVPSILAIGPDNAGTDGAATGSNAALGFDAGGNHVQTSAVVAPTYRGVMDGWPVTADFPGRGAIVVIIGDRSSADVGEKRRYEKLVDLDLTILRADPAVGQHRNREGIEAAVRCVREVIASDRHLGRAANGDIMYAEDGPCRISGMPFNFGARGAPVLFDGASMQCGIKVFERW